MMDPVLKLREFEDGDIPLFTKWLSLAHVARWFEHPDDWLEEIRNVTGEFGFIEHFIAELDGVPIGFGQVCDASIAQSYGGETVSGEEGETYGIDFFIGETAYLGRGHGKELVRLLAEAAERNPSARRVTADPSPHNTASIRTLLSQGFSPCSEEEGVYERWSV